MTSVTPRLELPLLAAAQAQKHVTHNEAISTLDALAQLVLDATNADTPPSTPDVGAVFALGVAPSGDWAGQGGLLAIWQQSGWTFQTPLEGWRAWDKSTATQLVYDGGAWTGLALGSAPVEGLGIQAAWDTTNRLAVASDAVLFTHAGGGHQLKVNKASASDTASLLFQSDWVGYAEMGLNGETAFSIKVSADGSTYDQALTADPVTQSLRTDYNLEGLAIQQNAQDATPGRLMRADWGYSPSTVVGTVAQNDGQPSGAVIESGRNAGGEFCRWADGTQMCWQVADLVFDTVERVAYDWTFPVSFVSPYFPVIHANILNEFGATPGPTGLQGIVASQGSSPNGTSCSLRVYRNDAASDFLAGDSLTAQAVAIGRWY